MHIAIELHFANEVEHAIRQLAASLAFLPAVSIYDTHTSRPHISLAGLEITDAQPVLNLVALHATSCTALSISLEGIGIFAGATDVVYLIPAPTQPLLGLHHQITQSLEQLNIAYEPFYRPTVWVPHCTIALTSNKALLAEVIVRAASQFKPITATCAQLAVVAYPDGRLLATYDLAMRTTTQANDQER